MAAQMLLAQPRGFSDKTKNARKLNEKSRDLKIVRDKKVASYLDDFTPTSLTEENAERLADSQKLASMAMSRVAPPRGRTGEFRNGKPETRQRTSSTDSAFSEESFVDLDSDGSTKLESLIEQLIFTDDRLRPDKTVTHNRAENLPPTDSNFLDVGDLFNNADNIFTVDFGSLSHDTYTPNFLESELRSDAECTTESLSSISSTESGKGSMDKYQIKTSAFLESHLDKVLNNSNTFASETFTKLSSNVFTSSDEEEVIGYGGNVGFNSASGSATGSDGCDDNDNIHENSFVDLSTFLDISSYGSSLYAEERLPLDPESTLDVDNHEHIHINGSSSISAACRNRRGNDIASSEGDRSQIKMADIGGVTRKTINTIKDGESHLDKVLNNSNTFASETFTKLSSNVFTSSDEEEVIEYGGNVGFNSASGSATGSDGCRNRRGNDIVSIEGDRSQIKMADTGGVTSKTINKSKDGETDIRLAEAHSCSRIENQKPEASFLSTKNRREKVTNISNEKPDKMADKNINEREEYSHDSLCLYSFENLCGHGDQEMSGTNQNKAICTFCDYNDPQNTVTLKNGARTNNSAEDRHILKIPDDKRPEIKPSNQKDIIVVDMSDPNAFHGKTPTDIDESVLPFGTKGNMVAMSSYLHGPEFFKDVNFAHIDKVRSMATRMFSNKGKAWNGGPPRTAPDQYKETNMFKTSTKEKTNGSNAVNNLHVKRLPVKRLPVKRSLAEDLNSVKRELGTSKEEKTPRKGRCLSPYAEFSHLKYPLEESSAAIESPWQKSANNNNISNSHLSDSFGCRERKVPKFSTVDTDKAGAQSPATSYKILAMGHHSSIGPCSASPCLPVTMQDHCYGSQYSIEQSLKNQGLASYLRQETGRKQAKYEHSEMKELEKYLRGIIPTENCDKQDEVLADNKQENNKMMVRMGRSPCSFLKQLLTGEMTAQMYRQIDKQFYENELLIQNEAKIE